MERSKALQIYMKPGIREDDLMLRVWDACRKHDRPQDVFRTMLRAGLRAMYETGELPDAVIEDCGLDGIFERRRGRSARRHPEAQQPSAQPHVTGSALPAPPMPAPAPPQQPYYPPPYYPYDPRMAHGAPPYHQPPHAAPHAVPPAVPHGEAEVRAPDHPDVRQAPAEPRAALPPQQVTAERAQEAPRPEPAPPPARQQPAGDTRNANPPAGGKRIGKIM